GPVVSGLSLKVYDGGLAAEAIRPAAPEGELLYGVSDNPQGDAAPPAWARWHNTYDRDLAVAGRMWHLPFADAPEPNPRLRLLPLVVLASGLSVSLLLFAVLYGIARARSEAIAMATRATRDLRTQLSFTQQLIEAMPNPVFYKDADGRYLGVNRA